MCVLVECVIAHHIVTLKPVLAPSHPPSPASTQETAAIAMARIASHRAQLENPFDVMRWLDRSLIKLVSKFAQFTKDDVASFQLAVRACACV
jgi:hypothetical protein